MIPTRDGGCRCRDIYPYSYMVILQDLDAEMASQLRTGKTSNWQKCDVQSQVLQEGWSNLDICKRANPNDV